jgi:hypothetical protein
LGFGEAAAEFVELVFGAGELVGDIEAASTATRSESTVLPCAATRRILLSTMAAR